MRLSDRVQAFRLEVTMEENHNMMKNKAAVQLSAKGNFTFTELDLAAPREDEVLVKITACGVCHTDLVMRRHFTHYPLVLGHEASGIVERTGKKVRRLKPGDRVALSYTYCGKCAACKAERTFECEFIDAFFEGFRQDGTSSLSLAGEPVAALIRQGGFAAYAVCHENAATRVDAWVDAGPDLRFLGPLGCGIITGAGSVLNYLKPGKGKPLAVFGTGCVGLSAVMAAKIAGSSPLIAIDRIPARLELAKEFGATHCINGDAVADIAGAIEDICGGIDYGFDTSGECRLLAAQQAVLNPNAAACGVGIGGSIHLSRFERNQGKTWESPTDGWSVPQKFIPYLLSLHLEGKFPFDRMIKFFPFAAIEEAFEASHSGAVVKPVLVME